jgi:hypothetical protein
MIVVILRRARNNNISYLMGHVSSEYRKLTVISFALCYFCILTRLIHFHRVFRFVIISEPKAFCKLSFCCLPVVQ